MAFNIHLDVPNAKGESKKANYTGQIEVLSWSWGMQKSGDPAMGAPTAGRVDVHDIEVIKLVDNSSGYLMKFCCNGTPLETITLTMDKANGDKLEFVKLILTGCIISSIRTGGDSVGERLVETIQIRFGAFSFSYVGQEEGAASSDCAFDIVGNANA